MFGVSLHSKVTPHVMFRPFIYVAIDNITCNTHRVGINVTFEPIIVYPWFLEPRTPPNPLFETANWVFWISSYVGHILSFLMSYGIKALDVLRRWYLRHLIRLYFKIRVWNRIPSSRHSRCHLMKTSIYGVFRAKSSGVGGARVEKIRNN